MLKDFGSREVEDAVSWKGKKTKFSVSCAFSMLDNGIAFGK